MSIQVREKEQKSSGFSMGEITLPDLKSKSSAIKIDTSNKNMEKKKESKIEKKKDEPKFFYELLEESWHNGIRSRKHTANDFPDSEYTYYCPICCVCELLELIPHYDQRGEQQDHDQMIYALREKKVKFIDRDVMVSIPDSHYYSGGHDINEYNEPLLAYYIASMYCDNDFENSGTNPSRLRLNNLDIARILKEQLYDKKIPQLPKEETRNMFDTWATPRMQHIPYPSGPFTVTMTDLKLGDSSYVSRPSSSFGDHGDNDEEEDEE
ncbi:hypothetical protein [Serratia sp. (in: enterobacteria)]|uniref:hypothetical protein n=1 Tax=Serratia sp. (in: enterobacteria) TaxID=616 RepID=UPI00398A394B